MGQGGESIRAISLPSYSNSIAIHHSVLIKFIHCVLFCPVVRHAIQQAYGWVQVLHNMWRSFLLRTGNNQTTRWIEQKIEFVQPPLLTYGFYSVLSACPIYPSDCVSPLLPLSLSLTLFFSSPPYLHYLYLARCPSLPIYITLPCALNLSPSLKRKLFLNFSVSLPMSLSLSLSLSFFFSLSGYDYSVDLWSFGVLLFELYEETGPFGPDDQEETELFTACMAYKWVNGRGLNWTVALSPFPFFAASVTC